MWTQVPFLPKDPRWADVKTAFTHTSGHVLVARETPKTTLWELVSPSGEVITNQYELPFPGVDGAPFEWATHELSRRKLA